MGDVSNTVWCSCVALNDGIELFFLFLSFVSKRALVLSVSSLVDLLLSLNLLGNEEEEKCWLPCCMGANSCCRETDHALLFERRPCCPVFSPANIFFRPI